jgi:hypothetical protein
MRGVDEPETKVMETPKPSGKQGIVPLEEIAANLIQDYRYHQSWILPGPSGACGENQREN